MKDNNHQRGIRRFVNKDTEKASEDELLQDIEELLARRSEKRETPDPLATEQAAFARATPEEPLEIQQPEIEIVPRHKTTRYLKEKPGAPQEAQEEIAPQIKTQQSVKQPIQGQPTKAEEPMQYRFEGILSESEESQEQDIFIRRRGKKRPEPAQQVAPEAQEEVAAQKQAESQEQEIFIKRRAKKPSEPLQAETPQAQEQVALPQTQAKAGQQSSAKAEFATADKQTKEQRAKETPFASPNRPVVQSEQNDPGKTQEQDEILVEIDQKELLRKQRVAMFTKPKIVLETPYTIMVGKKPRTRYRLEYDKPDKRIDVVDDKAAFEAMRKTQRKAKVRKEVLSWVATLAIAVLVALLINRFVFIMVQVDGDSMLDTLHTENRLFTWRAGYIFGQPQRGDVVICHYPDPATGLYTDQTTNYVKRVVGLPGERVSIQNGIVYINGEQLAEAYLSPERLSFDDMQEITLGEDAFFVMGDNRINSTDSRVVGPIARSEILGKAILKVYPFDEIGTLVEE